MCVLSIKVPIRKKSGNLFNDPRNLHTAVWFQVFQSNTNNYMVSSSYFYIMIICLHKYCCIVLQSPCSPNQQLPSPHFFSLLLHLSLFRSLVTLCWSDVTIFALICYLLLAFPAVLISLIDE